MAIGHAQFNFYILFLCSAIHNIALLSTVAKNEFARRRHIKSISFFVEISGKAENVRFGNGWSCGEVQWV